MDKRITWIDTARGIGILLVVFEHCCGALPNYLDDPRSRLICAFHMPLFFFLSGYCHKNGDRWFLKYTCSRAYALLLPSAFMGGMWNLIYLQQGVKGLIMYLSCWFQWFFVILFITSLLCYFISRIKNDILNIFLLFMFCVLGYFTVKADIHTFFHIEILPTAIVFYMIGMIVRRKELINIICNEKKLIFQPLILLALPFLGMISYLNGGVNMARNEYGYYILFLIGAMLGLYIVISISYYASYNMDYLSLFGRNSCGMFVLHSVLVLGILPWLGEKILRDIITNHYYSVAWIYFAVAIISCVPTVFLSTDIFRFYLAKNMQNRIKNHKRRCARFITGYRLFFLLFCVGTLAFYIFLVRIMAYDSELFNIESGIYYADQIEICYMGRAGCFYTLNGDDPDETKKTLNQGDTIRLVRETPLESFSIKLLKDGIIHHCTYILADEMYKEFDMPVISITSAHYNLYDYDYGVFVSGRTYDENAMIVTSGYIEGNYNQRTDDWIRDCHVTFADEGRIYYDKDISFIVSGQSSAGSVYNKSIKLISDQEDIPVDLGNRYMYSSIRLRNGSTDMMNYSGIRDSITSNLAIQSGYDGCFFCRPCIVFFNNILFGLYTLQTNYSNDYLMWRYSLPDNNIEKYKGVEDECLEESKVANLFSADLSVESNRFILERYVDIDSFLQYYAINILNNNLDWPQHNYEIWRYAGEPSFAGESKYTDGRWRCLMYDEDITFFSSETPVWKEENGFSEDVLRNIMTQYYDSVFYDMMKIDVYREKFINIIRLYLKEAYNEINLNECVEKEWRKIDLPMHLLYDQETYGNHFHQMQIIKDGFLTILEDLDRDFHEYFDCGLYD